MPLLAIADSWLPASLPDPPASRIVVASLFIGWALASAGDVWPMAMQGVVFFVDANMYTVYYIYISNNIYIHIKYTVYITYKYII